jgi:hypothetical protein
MSPFRWNRRDRLSSNIAPVARNRLRLERLSVSGYGEVMRMKEELAATLPDIRSLPDFGGCYRVHGHYLLQAARRLHLRLASMIDINVTPEFLCAAEELQRLGTHVETVHADFREGSTFA